MQTKPQRVLLILIGITLTVILSVSGSFKPNLNVVSTGALAQENPTATIDRFQTGLLLINQVNPTGYERSRDSLVDIAPDFIRLGIEFPYGDVLSRPGLDLKLRQIATVAALTALGTAQPQLRFHIEGALNVGCTREEIIELITQMSVYAGFPKAANAMIVAREVFQELDAQSS
ncbi:MAG: carboxymuconolactone decarboxylase family protein [Leptolyngbyaceae cyanobacterium SL_5_9]|nr:carboxymuconolactone decarboxylase family protein [Leptolyngbyaceae cyanobacterium SL_5_9]NJO73606.1 carboxymuconolactone decarboxylase family protein [Leptolyngbyaceae cyanobacterium RM1_406_9]